MELADTEIEPGESLVMVGFGFDEVLGTLGGKRRFRENSVTRMLSRGLGKEASMTRTYPYRVWVREEIHWAKRAAIFLATLVAEENSGPTSGPR